MISDLCVWQPQPRRPPLLCPLSRMQEAPFPLLRWAYRSIQGAGAGKESGGLVEGRGLEGPLSALPSSCLPAWGGGPGWLQAVVPSAPFLTTVSLTPHNLLIRPVRGLWTCPRFPSRPHALCLAARMRVPGAAATRGWAPVSAA